MPEASILGREKLAEIDRLLWIAKHDAVPGALAECGVYHGGILARMAGMFPERQVYGFDTFEGLPARDWSEGEVHKPGDFADTRFEQELDHFEALFPNVVLRKGYFPDTADDLAEHRFAFVHVDFDFYEGTRNAIEFFWPRINSGGFMVFDDYGWEHCPGVARAIHEAELAVWQTVPYQARIRKP